MSGIAQYNILDEKVSAMNWYSGSMDTSTETIKTTDTILKKNTTKKPTPTRAKPIAARLDATGTTVNATKEKPFVCRNQFGTCTVAKVPQMDEYSPEASAAGCAEYVTDPAAITRWMRRPGECNCC